MTNPSDQPQSERQDARGPLIFCGMCGALNPSTNFYCAACGTTLVDAFHASEGLRVYERADTASRLIEIVPAGTELEIQEDPNAPEDFVRVRIESGRLGYIRLSDVEAMAESLPLSSRTTPSGRPLPDENYHATGCISTTAALGSVALVGMVGLLIIVIAWKADTYDQGTMALVFCVGVLPLMILTVAFYLYAKSREDRFADEDDEARLRADTKNGEH